MEANEVRAVGELLDMDCPIKSLLENDLYKWSMGQFVTHRYPGAWVRVEFRCRSDVKIGWMKPVLDKWLDQLCTLRYTDGEIAYLRTIDWLAPDFIDYMRRFYLFRDQIHTEVSPDGQLVMWAEGPWRDVIWFEVPCLAMVEEAYMRYQAVTTEPQSPNRVQRLKEKIVRLNELYDESPFTLSEFGIRRRFSGVWQEAVVDELKQNCKAFVGTSNVYLARKFSTKPMGTMAHELYMGLQGCRIQLREVQRETWRQWMEEYRGKNGILLSDIFGFRACLADMDWYVANSFQGLRHDSGSPIRWGEAAIEKYESVGIDPKTKTLVWSDCLSLPVMETIHDVFKGRCGISFGWGTGVVNDCGYKPLSIVMKLTYAGYDKDHMTPVLKLSDDDGKGMCPDPALVEYAKHVYEYRQI